MRWIEILVEVPREAADDIVAVLHRYVPQGVAIEQGGFYIDTWEDEVPVPDRVNVRAYLADDQQAAEVQRQIEEALWHMGRISPINGPTYKMIDDEDWADAWKKHYHPLRIGKHIFIRPLWIDEPAQPGDILIALDPGMAFGTGTHPSTQLVLEAAEELLTEKPTMTVLDLGCGSGILAIGAVKLGAPMVDALDTDAMAVRITDENAAANGVAEKIKTERGSLESLLARNAAYDLALVNILAKVIIMMCGQGLGKIVKVGGVAVFGGIILEQADEVEAALRQTGLTPYKRRQQEDWVVIEARRDP